MRRNWALATLVFTLLSGLTFMLLAIGASGATQAADDGPTSQAEKAVIDAAGGMKRPAG